MAMKELMKISKEMLEKWSLHRIAFFHRLGFVSGDPCSS
jgi:molybdopterin synthase catalytic subunit